jgi:hypothetical protein
MTVSADILRRLAALKLPGDAFQEVLAILAEMQGADDARREGQRQRKSRSRSRDKSVTVTGQERDSHSDIPPHTPLEEERKIPEANASGPTQAELERELFRRGRQVCGKNSGGLIASLLKAKQHDVALARSVIETASTKHDPREYVAAAMRSKTNGRAEKPGIIEAADNLIDRIAELNRGSDFGSGADPGPVRLLPERGRQ